MTIREALRTLAALRISRGSKVTGVRSKIAGVLVWGWREHRKPTAPYVDPRVLDGTMSWDDPAQRTAPLAWGEGPEFETERVWECEVCEAKLTASAKEAHELGWDTPPYFTGYIKCDNCPINKTAIWAMWQ
jgi:hypothetical protein